MSDKDVKANAPIRPTMKRMWLAALGIILSINKGLGFGDNIARPLQMHRSSKASSGIHRSQKKRRLLARRANRYG